MIFEIDQIFVTKYPPEAAVWCNNNNAKIVELANGTYQIQAIPALTIEELSKTIRYERDARIEACQWIVDRHADQLAANITPTLTSEQYQAWLAYRQALRDLPQQEGFPWDGENVPYPEEPNT